MTQCRPPPVKRKRVRSFDHSHVSDLQWFQFCLCCVSSWFSLRVSREHVGAFYLRFVWGLVSALVPLAHCALLIPFVCRTETQLHREVFCTEKSLRRGAFTHRRSFTEKFLHRGVFTQGIFHTQTQ